MSTWSEFPSKVRWIASTISQMPSMPLTASLVNKLCSSTLCYAPSPPIWSHCVPTAANLALENGAQKTINYLPNPAIKCAPHHTETVRRITPKCALSSRHSGQIVTIESTWHAAKWYAPLTSQEECLIVGTEGEIHIHYQKSPQLEVSGSGIAGRAYYDWLAEERYEVCYRDLLLEFADSIREGREPSVTGTDGRIALSVIEAAYRSSKTGA